MIDSKLSLDKFYPNFGFYNKASMSYVLLCVAGMISSVQWFYFFKKIQINKDYKSEYGNFWFDK